MPELFGLDIAGIVGNAINAAGGLQDGTLIKRTAERRDPSNPAAEPTITESRHTFSGFIEVRQFNLPGTLIAESGAVLSLIGASITPVAAPATNDRAEMAGITYTLGRQVSADPATALYEFEVT